MPLGDGKTEGDGTASPFGNGNGDEGAMATTNDFVTNPQGNAPRNTGNDFVTNPAGTAARSGPTIDAPALQGPKAPTGDPKDLDKSSLVPGSGPARVALADVPAGPRAKFVDDRKPFKLKG